MHTARLITGALLTGAAFALMLGLESEPRAGLAAPVPSFATQHLPFPGAPSRVRFASLDADGTLDIVASGFSPVSTFDNWVAVYTGDGGGGFTRLFAEIADTGSSISSPHKFSSLQVGDLDLDDDLDLTFGDSYSGFFSALNDGDGNFPEYLGGAFFGGYTRAHLLTPLNDDDILDLIIYEDDFGGWFLDWGYGAGEGHFFPEAFIDAPPGGKLTELALGDIDGDGVADYVQANESGIVVHSGFRGGDPSGIGPMFFFELAVRDVVLADLDADGHLDLAATQPLDDVVVVYFGDGKGALDGPLRIRAGRQPEFLAAGDFDGDGRNDLAVSNAATARVTVLLNPESAPWRSRVSLVVKRHPGEIDAADLDGDGDDDLVVVNRNSGSLTVLRSLALP